MDRKLTYGIHLVLSCLLLQRRWQVVIASLLAGLILVLLWPAPIPAQAQDPVDFISLWLTYEVKHTLSMAWGDMDGDGDLDLAVGNYSDTNQLYRNDGQGHFTEVADALGTEYKTTFSVAWGDMDGDGDLDLAVGNYTDPNQLYRNDGQGHFTEVADPLGTEYKYTHSVAWGDMDGDGDLDLAVGNNSSPNQLYCNDGQGHFTEVADALGTEAKFTASVAWGDMDGDGDLDLAVGTGSPLNQLYRNDGQGHFVEVANALEDGDTTTSIAWGDMDGDGDLDLAVGTWYSSPNQLYRNDGQGHFTKVVDALGTEAKYTASVVWGDMDGDGDLDLAIGNFEEPNQLYRNDGQGHFVEVVEALVTEDRPTTNMAWGDMDGDGDLDLAVGNLDCPNQLYRNDRGRYFVEVADALGTEGEDTWSMAWGDMDGDGDLDLAVGVNHWGDPNQLYRNDGQGHFTEVADALGTKGGTTSIVWGDMDGDGDLDLAVGNESSPNQLYCNDGQGHFTEVADALGTDTEDKYTYSVAWGDMDGDGDLDLAVGNTFFGQPNQLYRNDGQGSFTEVADALGTENRTTHSVAWGDMDGDGDLDLAVGNVDYPNQLYRNDDQGHFVEVANALGTEDKTTSSVAWGDMDGDGDLDLAVGNSNYPNQLYRNDGEGHFTEVAGALGIPYKSTQSVAWGDMDGDGDLDLAVGIYGYPSKLYRNDGHGGFTEVADALGTEYKHTRSVAWGDMDGDGDLDLAVGNSSEPNSVYENPRLGGAYLANNPPGAVVHRPGATADAFFLSTPQILESSLIPLTYALFDPEFDAVSRVQGYYSLDGGGQWFPAVPTNTITTSLATGGVLARRASDGLPWPLPDLGTITATLSIASAYEIADLDIWVAITHTRDDDLEVYLRSPSGTLVELFTDVGGSGDNFDYTVLSDQASTPIISGTAPFTGTYRPEGNLAAFSGETTAGTWALIVADDWSADTGTLIAWGLHIKTAPVDHVYNWDTFACRFFGQSDHVVFRLDVYGGGGGPFQRAKTTVYSPPFRVRGMQVRVYSEMAVDGNEAAGAMVYRRNEDVGSSLMVDSIGIPLYTDQNGYLQGRGEISLSDQLLAMLPVSTVAEYAGVLLFDGIDDTAFITPLNSVPITETTVSFWISTTQATGAPFVYASSPDDNTLVIANPDNLTLWRGDVCSITTGVTVTDGMWHHIAVTWYSNDGQVKLYKDGVAAYTGTLAAGTVISPGGSLALGQDQDSGAFFKGILDEVRIWNTVRAEEQILDEMYGVLDTNDSDLAASWSFDDPANPGTDVSSNANDLTLSGATWDGDYLGGYTVYHTNGTPTESSVDAFDVISPGVQEIAVSAQHPLILFDLNLSLEWDAHNDPIYLQQLEVDLKKASAYLYDFTNGQVALGHITAYQNADYWASSHIAVQASNRLRPFASIGGLPLEVFTETVTVDGQEHTLTYGPGQIRMGATWNRYGDPAASVGVDWPLILAHELSHYLLYQYDVYMGLNEAGLLVPVDTCTGSAMGDVYAIDNTEFISDTVHWTDWCSQTLAAKTLGRTEWETLHAWYPWLITPTLANDGPSQMPFEFTTVEIVAPTQVQETIEDPTFYLDYQDGVVGSSEARAFLLRDADNIPEPDSDDYFEFIYDLGSPIGGQNRVVARGARPGDRLCVFDNTRAQFGCEVIAAGDERLTLKADATWQPVIQLSPVNSTTFVIQITELASITNTLRARIFPEFGTVFTPTTLAYANGIYTAALTLPYPVMSGHVQVWVDEPASETSPRREAMVNYSIGGNPGTSRASGIGTSRASGIGTSRASGIGTSRASGIGTSRASGIGSLYVGEAPLVSPDGQMILYLSDVITFAEGQFYTIQAMAGLPDPPAGRTLVGQGYNLVATGFLTDTAAFTGSVSIQYLGSDVLVAGVDENDLVIYFRDGTDWTALDTALNTTYNMASARSQGTGVYALMASIKTVLSGPGWNLIAYSVRGSQLVTQALLSISGYYTTVYGYEADDPNQDPWKVYDVTAPEWVNDLTMLEFNHGYWINISEAITLYLSSSALALEPTSLQATLPLPPATFYGTIDAAAAWTPETGMPVTARIDGTLCGQTSTREVDGHVVYAVNVFADDLRAGCGTPGKRVVFQMDGRTMAPAVLWDDRQVWPVTLHPGWQVYLPLVMKAWP